MENNTLPSISVNGSQAMFYKWVYWAKFTQGIVGLLANTLTILCILISKPLRQKTTNLLIGSLSTCNLFLSVAHVSDACMQILSSDVWRKLYMYTLLGLIENMLYFLSLLTIFLIGSERFLATVCPICYQQKLTLKHVAIAVVATWVFTMISLPPSVLCHHQDLAQLFKHFIGKCIFVYSIGPLSYLIICLTTILYLVIFIKIRHQQRKITATETGTLKKNSKVSVKVTKMTFLTMTFYLVSWVPVTVYSTAALPLGTHGNPDRYQMVLLLLRLTLQSSTYTNCLVYAWQHTGYRLTYKYMLTCGKQGSV